uniref:Uncharacterized protein n=1 Tax=Chenopodium quinoa TaxID=63459 RepID=A0A803MIW4_CHEQI
MAAAEGIPTTYPSHPPEIVGVATSADEVPVLRSPPPSDDEDLRSQPVVEYYFSDENLPNDKFLLKQMKKDKDRFAYYAAANLSNIEAYKDEKAYKRHFNNRRCTEGVFTACFEFRWEESKATTSSSIKRGFQVVVANLPEDHSVQNIQNICGRAGSIKTISIHDPHAAADSVKRNKAEKLVNGKIYALVEYETVEAAEKAVAALNDETDWRNGLRVQHLQKRKGNGLGRKVWRESDSEKGGLAQDGEHRSKEGNGQKGRNRSKGRKYRGNNGMGHGMATTIESSNKPPPGPRMPDGTRGFTMGRGRLPTSCHS